MLPVDILVLVNFLYFIGFQFNFTEADSRDDAVSLFVEDGSSLL